MKRVSTLAATAQLFRRCLFATGLLALFLIPVNMHAQADTVAPEKTAPAAPELIAPSLEFTAVQKGDNSFDLKAALQAKINGAFVKLYQMKISFVQVTDSAEKALGFVITDVRGKATLNVSAKNLDPVADGKYHFKAMFAGNKSADPADGEVTFSRARIEMVPEKADSLLTVKVKFLAQGADGVDTAVKDATIGIYVKRMFNPMKVAEGTTDENGEATIEIPQNLPGDAKGNITLLAKVDENEQFGNLETAVVQPWGVAVSDQSQELPRALWSSHPPLWMLITFIILMVTVWGHYIVIVYEMFRLKKDAPQSNI